MNSGPLSTTMLLGRPRTAASCSSAPITRRRQRGIDVDARTLAGEFIDHGEAAEAPAADARIVDEVHPPALVRFGRRRQRDARLRGAFARAVGPHEQALLPIQPIHALEIDHDAFAAQQHMQPPVAKARPLRRELFQSQANRRVAQRAPWLVVPARSRQADQPHRSSRAHVVGGSQMGDDTPPLPRRHHFRPATSLSIAMSSAWSATSFFRRRFSSSSVRSRLASFTWSPP
jgi:hypothetical protein